MEMKNNHSFLVLFLCFSLGTNLSIGEDTISMNESVSSGQTIISSSGTFELGFFTPGNSFKYYLGIWYKNISSQTVVWVANRETPVSDAAHLTIIQGNLVLLDKFQSLVWSTNISRSVPPKNLVIAVLRDDGNLILSDLSSNSSTPLLLWQSFDYPTHAFLPGGKVGYDKRTQRKQVLISWKDLNDPSPGLFSMELDPRRAQLVIKWNRTTQYWASSSCNGRTFSSVPGMRLNYIFNYSYIDNENESYFTYSLYNSEIPSKFIMDVSGQIKQLLWSTSLDDWYPFWAQPTEQCDVYANCGAFGVCNNVNSSCNCLSGFKARSDAEWNSNNYSSGCVRVRDQEVQCNGITQDKDSFWMNSIVSLPASQDTNITVAEASQCRSACFNNCSCTAYSYDVSGACSIWTGDLFNLQQLSKTETEKTIFVKSGSPEDQTKAKKSMKLVVLLSSTTAFIVLCFSYFYYRRRRRRMTKGTDRINDTQGTQISHLDKIGGGEIIDVPYFRLETILVATDNFSNANKLGQGGFGPVYKGIFPGGKEIAVKRLSSHSGQGIDEFKNEVTLIAKLQHRNLVRLLGYCINGKEQILLYEYMPNKSLDTFIFDGELCKLLDWKKRYDIILGIGRGLAYLHHDSRLRIIHRDLKTSNILLDEDMNPKIADFGLARIVEGRRTEAKTEKIVGTYGYMSPEYASDGLFSLKSDVFSFGVVILEMISGRKNTGFYQSEEALNLLGYAWRMWIEERAMQLTEKSLLESCNRSEVMKCINVALLCVQEDSNDRPKMSDVIVMLVGEGTSLQRPNRPAFVLRTHASSRPSSPSKVSNNQVTITEEGGR